MNRETPAFIRSAAFPPGRLPRRAVREKPGQKTDEAEDARCHRTDHRRERRPAEELEDRVLLDVDEGERRHDQDREEHSRRAPTSV